MNVSCDDAAVIYARACRAWYGRSALRVVTGKVDELRRRGDADGVAAWTKVAAVLSQAKSPKGDRPEKAHARLY
jgi:hypothetical protein